MSLIALEEALKDCIETLYDSDYTSRLKLLDFLNLTIPSFSLPEKWQMKTWITAARFGKDSCMIPALGWPGNTYLKDPGWGPWLRPKEGCFPGEKGPQMGWGGCVTRVPVSLGWGFHQHSPFFSLTLVLAFGEPILLPGPSLQSNLYSDLAPPSHLPRCASFCSLSGVCMVSAGGWWKGHNRISW